MTTQPAVALDQRRKALTHANEIRKGKRLIKEALKDETLAPLDAIKTEWGPYFKLDEFLLAVPLIGKVKAKRIVAHIGAFHSRRLGELTSRQLVVLRDELR